MPMKVLIIDSDDDVRSTIDKIMTENKVMASGSPNGIEGVTKAMKDLPDLIFLALVLDPADGIPMDGIEVLRALREATKLMRVPVIILCEKTEKEAILKAKKMGAQDFLIKPLKPESVLEKTNKYLKLKAKADAADGGWRGKSHQKEETIKISIGRKILAIDDDPFARSLIKKILKEKGYKIRVAADGMDGLKEMVKDRPDLILLDLMMPVMSGFSVLDKIKQIEALEGVPVLVISANAEMNYVRRALAKGALDYVLKPIRPSVLVEKMETVFRGGSEDGEPGEIFQIEKPLDGKSHLLLISANNEFIDLINDNLTEPYIISVIESVDKLEETLKASFSEFILVYEPETPPKLATEICARLRNLDNEGILKPYLYYARAMEQNEIDAYKKAGIKECISKPESMLDFQDMLNMTFQVNLVEVMEEKADRVTLRRKKVLSTVPAREMTRLIQDFAKNGKKRFVIDLSALEELQIEEIQHLSRFTNYQTKLGIMIRFVVGSDNVRNLFKDFLENKEVLLTDTVEEALDGWS